MLCAGFVPLGLPEIRGSREVPRTGRWTAGGGAEAGRWSCWSDLRKAEEGNQRAHRELILAGD